MCPPTNTLLPGAHPVLSLCSPPQPPPHPRPPPQFEGESGVDAGGLTVEMYQQLFSSLFGGGCALMESVAPEDGGPDTPRFLPAVDVGGAVDCSMQSLRMYEGVGRFLMKR